MYIEKGYIGIRTIDEGVNNNSCPATVEIYEAATGKLICKLKAVNKPGPGADGNTYPFIQFEEINTCPKTCTGCEDGVSDYCDKATSVIPL
jgi:hypothetical protein